MSREEEEEDESSIKSRLNKRQALEATKKYFEKHLGTVYTDTL